MTSIKTQRSNEKISTEIDSKNACSAGNRNLIWIMVSHLFAYAARMHFYTLWGLLPDRYNLMVVVMIPHFMYADDLLVKLRTNKRKSKVGAVLILCLGL
jgi:hypothetical protein